MPKNLFEIKNFNRGVVSSPSESDIPDDAASYSKDLDPNGIDGKLTGRKGNTDIVTSISGDSIVRIEDSDNPNNEDILVYDSSSSTLNEVKDLTGTPATTELSSSISGNASSGFSKIATNHVRLSGGPNNEAKWIGYIGHQQWEQDISGIKIESSECKNLQSYPFYDKIVAHGGYIFGLDKGTTKINKHSGTDGSFVASTDYNFLNLQAIDIESDSGKLYVYDRESGTSNGVIYKVDTSTLNVEDIHACTIHDSDKYLYGVSQITGVTSLASTDVFTKTSHGLSNGDTVTFSGFSESTEINGLNGIVEDVTPDTFKVIGINVTNNETTGGTASVTAKHQFVGRLAEIYEVADSSYCSSNSCSYNTNTSDQRQGYYQFKGSADYSTEGGSTPNGTHASEVWEVSQADSALPVSGGTSLCETADTNSYVSDMVAVKRRNGDVYITLQVYGAGEDYTYSSTNYKRGYSGGLLWKAKLSDSTAEFRDCTPSSELSSYTGTTSYMNTHYNRYGGSPSYSASNIDGWFQNWFVPTSDKDNYEYDSSLNLNFYRPYSHIDFSGGGNGARHMKVMFYPSEYGVSNGYSGRYNENSSYDLNFESISAYFLTLERTGRLAYNDGDSSSDGTLLEGNFTVDGRIYGGQAWLSFGWKLSSGNYKANLSKVRYALYDIPVVSVLNGKFTMNTNGDVTYASGRIYAKEKCFFHEGIGIIDLRIDDFLDNETNWNGEIKRLFAVSAKYNTGVAGYKDGRIWVAGPGDTNENSMLYYEVRSAAVNVGSNGNYTVSSTNDHQYSEAYSHPWATPLHNITGNTNLSVHNSAASTGSGGTFSPSLPNEGYGWVHSGRDDGSVDSNGFSIGTVDNAGDDFPESNKVFTLESFDNNDIEDLTMYVMPSSGSSAVYKLDDGRPSLYSSATTLGKSIISVSVSDSVSGADWDTDKEYYWAVSLIYDGYQESPLTDSVSRQSAGGKGFTVRINITDYLTNLPKRVSHVNLYRAEAQDSSVNEPETLFRLVKNIELDSSWTTSSDDKYIDIIDTSYEKLGVTYDSNSGVSETLPHTHLDYGLSAILNSSLFVTNASGVGINNVETYIFKSLPYKYDMFDWSQDFVILPESLTALAAYSGRIFGFSENNIYRIDPNVLFIEDVYEGVGCLSQDSFVITEFGMFFADKDNIYVNDGTNTIPIGDSILRSSDGDKGYLEVLGSSIPKLGFDPNNGNLIVFVNSSYSYVYNITRKRWDIWTGVITDTVYSGKSGELYVIDSTNNKIIRYADPSASKLGYEWVSKNITLGQQSQDKKFYRIDIPYEGTAPTVNFGVNGGALTETSTDGSTTGLKSLVFKDKKRSIQIKVEGSSDTEVESIGVVFRPMIKLTKVGNS